MGNGLLGDAIGKIGNVIFKRWKGLNVASQYQPDIADAKTPAQLAQRARLLSLINALRPLNKDFIKLYNSRFDEHSTPWAVAIKDNMQAVTEEGVFIFDNLRLGKDKIPQPFIFTKDYDPFINQIHIVFDSSVFDNEIDNLLPILLSCIGKYNNPDLGYYENTPLVDLPPGHFWCVRWFSDDDPVCYDNHWGRFGLGAFLYTDLAYRYVAPNKNLLNSAFTFDSPVIKYPWFNFLHDGNQCPAAAISWQFIGGVGTEQIQFEIDISKTTIGNPSQRKIKMWLMFYGNNETLLFESDFWVLSSTNFIVDAALPIKQGMFIVLYALHNLPGVQVSLFNRLTNLKPFTGDNVNLLDGLFLSACTSPSSFKTDGFTNGLCGWFDALFSDFIKSGIEPVIDLVYWDFLNNPYFLFAFDPVYISQDGTKYYYEKDTVVNVQIDFAEGWELDAWTGANAGEIVDLGASLFQLTLNDNKVANCIPKEIPAAVYLSMDNLINGLVKVTNLANPEGVNIGPGAGTIECQFGETAYMQVLPSAGYGFSDWGDEFVPDHLLVVHIGGDQYSIVMSKDMYLKPLFYFL